MKLGKLIEIFFFKNYAENEEGRLVPDLFIFKKSVIAIVSVVVSVIVKASGLQLNFNIFRYSST